MKKILSLCLIVISSNLYSAELVCSIRQNLDPISETQVSTSVDQKISIDSVEGVYAYVTEKAEGHFILEAYLVDYDLRIYGEGSLRETKDKVIASAWGRSSMVDIECRLAESK
jgi:hypothetical protein